MSDCSKKSWLLFADEFSWRGWSFEGAVRIQPPNALGNESSIRRSLQRPLSLFRSALRLPLHRLFWRRVLSGEALEGIDFVLIESAWNGFRNKSEIVEVPIALAKACRRFRVPTVYWNKEDPVYFERFLPVALSCDVILTTDSNCIDRYRAAGFGGIIDVMVFPAQPKLHRQYLPKDERKRVFFAGSYRLHSARVPSYQLLLEPAMDFGLDIFSRQGEWPEEYAGSIVGTLPYTELLKRYSAYAVGLNISSVKHSPTMFPRRVVEMPLADVLVVSDESAALANLFPSIPQSLSAKETKLLLNRYLNRDDERIAVIEETKKTILDKHTYRIEYSRICDRLKSIAAGRSG